MLITMISCHKGPLTQLDLHGFKKFDPDTVYWPVVNQPKAFWDIDILEYYPYHRKKNKNINWANIYICYVKDTKDTIVLIECKQDVSEFVYENFNWFIIDLEDKRDCPTVIYADLPKKNKVNVRFKYFCGTPKAVLD